MRFRASSTWPALPHHVFRPHHICHPAAATFYRAIHATPSGSSGGGGGAQDNYLLVPGATMATILMLGILHARRLYNDKKVEDIKEEGIEPEFYQISMKRGVFYCCVVYLKPGDYHRVHSPLDWHLLKHPHFSGHLFPQNERAVRTTRNLYVENERVVLEGQWGEGFVALSPIGATNVGSIQVAAFKMGSTVVLVFQAPVSESSGDGLSLDFRFRVKSGGKVKLGEAIGRQSEPQQRLAAYTA